MLANERPRRKQRGINVPAPQNKLRRKRRGIYPTEIKRPFFDIPDITPGSFTNQLQTIGR